jgi:hypothetical protein
MAFKKKTTFSLVVGCIVSLITGCDDSSNKADEPYRNSPPVLVALNSMGLAFQQDVSELHIMQVIGSRESPTTATVTIEERGLLDDSILARKTVFSMLKESGQWKINNRVKAQRCYPDRGHQDYSADACL